MMRFLYTAVLAFAIFPPSVQAQQIEGLPPDLAWVNELVRQARSQSANNRTSQANQNSFQNRVGIQPDKIEVDTPAGKLIVPRPRQIQPDLSKLLYTENPNWRSGGFRIPEPNPNQVGNMNLGVGIGNGVINGYLSFANATQAFRNRDFEKAKRLLQPMTQMTATQKGPLMPMASFIMLANGDYQTAAEFAYAAASFQQEWDWKQIQSTYPSTQIYESHYRQLQEAANTDPANRELQFLVGYHHLMLGHREHAQSVFSRLTNEMPNDTVVKRLLRQSAQPVSRPPAPMDFPR